MTLENETQEKNKLTGFIGFILGEDPKIDLEFMLKSLSWVVVSAVFISIGFLISKELPLDHDFPPIFDEIIGIILSLFGAILSIFCLLRVFFAILYPFKGQSFVRIICKVFSAAFVLLLLLSALRGMAFYKVSQVKKIITSSHLPAAATLVDKDAIKPKIPVSPPFKKENNWNWDMVTAIGTWFLSVGTLVAVCFQQKSNNRLTQAQTFFIYTDRWDSDRMRKNRKDLSTYLLLKLNGELEKNSPSAQDDVLNFFEELGMALKQKYLDMDMVWQAFSHYILYYWSSNNAYIDKDRKDSNDSTYFSEFQYLFEQMYKIEIKKKLRVKIPEDKLKEFLESEENLTLT
jgi:branched-subunit amino acid transport protein AzlD